MGIKTSSVDTFGIVFKRSIIENIEVDFGVLIKKFSFHISFLNAIILKEKG